MSQIPAPRAPLIEKATGQVSRVWYTFFRDNLMPTIRETDSDIAVGNDVRHVVCTGAVTVSLPAAQQRNSVVSVTNAGTDTVTIQPSGTDTINGAATLAITSQWTTWQLLPIKGGYVTL